MLFNPQSSIRNPQSRPRAFTLVELLVVIGIIAVLIGLLFPVIGIVKDRGREADTRSLVASLAQACERYALDFGGAFPGPLSNGQLDGATVVPMNIVSTLVAADGYAGTANQPIYGSGGNNRITMSENLYLGLLGGMVYQGGALVYDPRTGGQGPANLGALSSGRKSGYYNAGDKDTSIRVENGLRTGQYKDEAGSAFDSIIPEFVDRMQNPMPILYFRASRSIAPNLNPSDGTNNNVVTYFGSATAPYSLAQNASYIGKLATSSLPSVTIGVGRRITFQGGAGTPADPHGLRTITLANTTISSATSNPFDAYAYFVDRATVATPNVLAANRAKQKDRFILISAGRDRVYGTEDDICSPDFGTVGQ